MRNPQIHFLASLLAGIISFVLAWAFLSSIHPWEPGEVSILIWWAGLCAVSVFNLALWGTSFLELCRKAEIVRWPQLWLSLIYVLVCAFRSFVPRVDVQRICFFDSRISSVAVGRSLATLAELSFAAQWALLLREYSIEGNDARAKRISYLIFPLIALAQVCCWYATLTTRFIGHAFEESLWGISAALFVAGILSLRVRSAEKMKKGLAWAAVFGVAYVAYMFLEDVPMYVSRALEDRASGKQFLTIGQGLADVLNRRVVTFRVEDWRPEFLWMSLYFSVGVWASISIPRAPRFAAK